MRMSIEQRSHCCDLDKERVISVSYIYVDIRRARLTRINYARMHIPIIVGI